MTSSQAPPGASGISAPLTGRGPLRLSPTDVAQFLRFGQCERHLRPRLHERIAGRGFLKELGVEAQAIPPLLTRAGIRFEERVEAAIARALPTVDLAAVAGTIKQSDDNDRVIGEARASAERKLILVAARSVVELFSPDERVFTDALLWKNLLRRTCTT